MMPMLRILILLLLAVTAVHAAPYPEPVHGDATLRNFRFSSGDVLPEIRMHYFTLGSPARNAAGRIDNAVLLLHGTTGNSGNFLRPGLADELFGAGQPLDAARYFIIVPDNLGHGKSTKPSDGLRARFPRYGYADMVSAQHRLLTEALGVERLRLIVGTSMGGMHAWLWAVTHPDSVDAALPLVCLPAQISGRNRIQRRLISDAIRGDPEWMNGDYSRPPQGLNTGLKMALMGASSARQLYLEAPTQEQTDRLLDKRIQERLLATDANDFLYAWEASRDYDPGPRLPQIKAAVTAVNFEDDAINPPELGIFELEVGRVPGARAVLIPASDRTRGHISFYDATLWKHHLVELLERSTP